MLSVIQNQNLTAGCHVNPNERSHPRMVLNENESVAVILLRSGSRTHRKLKQSVDIEVTSSTWVMHADVTV